MAARTDHDRRDAQHAARATIAITMGRYIRRVTEEAYAHIEERATRDDGKQTIDWSAVGAAAADRAIGSYLGAANPDRAIDGDGGEVAEIAAGEDITNTDP